MWNLRSVELVVDLQSAHSRLLLTVLETWLHLLQQVPACNQQSGRPCLAALAASLVRSML